MVIQFGEKEQPLGCVRLMTQLTCLLLCLLGTMVLTLASLGSVCQLSSC